MSVQVVVADDDVLLLAENPAQTVVSAQFSSLPDGAQLPGRCSR
jgi:hypothetical protein